MSEIHDRAYAILKEKGPMRGSDLGWELWGSTTESVMRGTGSHGHNKFCRPAGRVLRHLQREGRVIETCPKGYTCFIWTAV